MNKKTFRGGRQKPPSYNPKVSRDVEWFHELDSWTEYWDIYHPETRGRYYFGDGAEEKGLLTLFLPREIYPPTFIAWKQMALRYDSADKFIKEARKSDVSAAVLEVDELVAGLFNKYFGDASDDSVKADYLDAMFRFATDSLPPARERDALISDQDPRKPTAGRHTLDGDLMWFAWSLHLEAAYAIKGVDGEHVRRSLQLAAIATGCAANFAWRGHRRTRSEYKPDLDTAVLLNKRGMHWATDFNSAAKEIHSLYRIREWGQDE